MKPALIYMVKTAIYLAGLYTVYFLFLSRDTSYGRNRYFILASLLLSLILPFVNLGLGKVATGTVFSGTLSSIIVTGSGIVNLPHPGEPDLKFILYRIYISGVLILGLKLILDLARLAYLIVKSDKRDGNIIKITSPGTSGYSAFGLVFMNDSLPEDEFREIYYHEMHHIRLFHFYDILFIEVLQVFQWFNPFIYMMNRSLRSVHEYQADEICLRSGISVVSYQQLLFSQVLKSRLSFLSNTFSNPSLLKKRMIMMTKKPSPSLANLKIIFTLPVIVLCFLVVAACSNNDKTTEKSGTQTFKSESPNVPVPSAIANDTIYVVVEKMPQFPGGEKALMEYIYAHLVYPKEAMDNNIQGRVILRFCVNNEGRVELVSVIKGAAPVLDNEAVRVVESMPGWTPGEQSGKRVSVWYSLPISFNLK